MRTTRAFIDAAMAAKQTTFTWEEAWKMLFDLGKYKDLEDHDASLPPELCKAIEQMITDWK